MTRRTKIVATLGPATDDPVALESAARAGVDVVRLNLSHGPIDEHLERLERVRAVAERSTVRSAVLADLPGPKVRAGRFPEGGVELVAGAFVQLEPGDGPSDAGTIRRVRDAHRRPAGGRPGDPRRRRDLVGIVEHDLDSARP
jgi:pyruvate kinase